MAPIASPWIGVILSAGLLAAGCGVPVRETSGPADTGAAPAAAEAPRVYRTANGKVFATEAERSAYLHRNAAEERALIALEARRQEMLTGSLAAQQSARRMSRLRRLESESLRLEDRERQARRTERAIDRELRRIDAAPRLARPGEPDDRLTRQREERRIRRLELERDRARRAARRAERESARNAGLQRQTAAEARAARRAERAAPLRKDTAPSAADPETDTARQAGDAPPDKSRPRDARQPKGEPDEQD